MTSFEALGRGLLNARANWELIVVQLVQLLAVTLVMVLGLVPLFAALGVGSIAAIPEEPEELARWLVDLFARTSPASLLAGVTGLLLIWLVAMLVYSYFQAGLFGVLVSAEHQAPPGSVSEARLFRTFRAGDFFGWSRRFMWRLFWFFNVFGAVALAGVLLVVVFIALVAFIGGRYGAVSGFTIGCIGALPILFALVAFSLWAVLAQVELVRPGAGFWPAQRQALEVLGRRLGAASLIWLIWVGFSVILGLAFGVVSMVVEIGLSASGVAKALTTLMLTVLQWAVGAVLTLCMGAACAALARSALRTEVTA